MTRRKSLTQEEIDSIIKDYKSGITYKSIAKKHGIAPTSIVRHLPANLRRCKKRRLLTKEEVRMLIEDRKNGMLYRELASKYGVHIHSIVRILPKEHRTKQSHRESRLDDGVLEYVGGDTTSYSAAREVHTSTKDVCRKAHKIFPEKFRKFDAEFRKRVVLDAIGASAREVSKLYGISMGSVTNWKRLYRNGELETLGEYHLKKNDRTLMV